jgi:enoyl-[acyl-carrier protein] reductase II
MAIQTRVTERLGIEAPILSAGMARYTDARLVAAVSNAGGLGILGTLGREPKEVETEIASIRAQTTRPFGVNVVLAEFEESTWGAVINARPSLINTSWGNPAEIVNEAHETGCLVAHQVTTVETAIEAVNAGVDFLIAQGTDGGGHIGWVTLMALLPQVVDVANGIPVIAAGSVVDGRGLAAALALGAEGVLVGTRFLATPEAPIPDYWKTAILGARSEAVVQNDVADAAWNVQWNGATIRTIENQLVRDWRYRIDELRSASESVSAEIDAARDRGDAEYVPLYMGQGAGGIKELLPASEIIRNMVADAEVALARANEHIRIQSTSA